MGITRLVVWIPALLCLTSVVHTTPARAATGDIVAHFAGPQEPRGMAYDRHNQTLWVYDSDGQQIILYDLTGTQLGTVTPTQATYPMGMAPNASNRMFVTNLTSIWDISNTGTETKAFDNPSGVFADSVAYRELATSELYVVDRVGILEIATLDPQTGVVQGTPVALNVAQLGVSDVGDMTYNCLPSQSPCPASPQLWIPNQANKSVHLVDLNAGTEIVSFSTDGSWDPAVTANIGNPWAVAWDGACLWVALSKPGTGPTRIYQVDHGRSDVPACVGVTMPDAGPPDAPPATPDTGPTAPDASPTAPDTSPGAPDTSPGAPDAMQPDSKGPGPRDEDGGVDDSAPDTPDGSAGDGPGDSSNGDGGCCSLGGSAAADSSSVLLALIVLLFLVRRRHRR